LSRNRRMSWVSSIQTIVTFTSSTARQPALMSTQPELHRFAFALEKPVKTVRSYRNTPPLSNNEIDALGPLSTAAIEYHRVDTGRRGDEHPMFSTCTKAQVRYALRHKNLTHQVPARRNAVHT